MENEELQQVPITTRSVGIRYGLFMAAFGILYFVVLMILNIDMSQGPGRWVGIIINAAFMFLAHKNYKDNGNGFMSYSQGMGIVFWMTLFSTVISSVFTYIYTKFIDSSFIQKILENQEEAMLNRGMSSEQVEQAMRMTEKFMTPEMMFVFGLIGGFVILIICGLIVTLFTKKANPEMPI